MSHCHKHHEQKKPKCIFLPIVTNSVSRTPSTTTAAADNMRTFFFIGTGVVQTITIPPNVSTIRVKLWGGGGGGGGDSAGSAGGGGGGAGGYLESAVNVIPGQVYSIIVGGGGAGGDTTPSDGEPGEDTTFTDNGVDFIAGGGTGGGSGSSLNPNGVGGIAVINSGGIGAYTSQGGNGEVGAGNTPPSISGDGGNATAGGSGGRNFTLPTNEPEAGHLPGGGGGGGTSGSSVIGPFPGGNGADGLAIIIYPSPADL